MLTRHAATRNLRKLGACPRFHRAAYRACMAKQLDYHTIREIFRRFREERPEPEGELEHVNAYTLLVAVAPTATSRR